MELDEIEAYMIDQEKEITRLAKANAELLINISAAVKIQDELRGELYRVVCYRCSSILEYDNGVDKMICFNVRCDVGDTTLWRNNRS